MRLELLSNRATIRRTKERIRADFKIPPECRDQIVLFPEKLNEAIASDHPVRLLDGILRRIDWDPWEAKYSLVRGQPPIRPRVVAGAIL